MPGVQRGAWAWAGPASAVKPELHWPQDAVRSETRVTMASMYITDANSMTLQSKSLLKPVLCCLAEGTDPCFPGRHCPTRSVNQHLGRRHTKRPNTAQPGRSPATQVK